MHDKESRTNEKQLQQEKIYQSIKDTNARHVIRTQIPSSELLVYFTRDKYSLHKKADLDTLAQTVAENPEDSIRWIFGVATSAQNLTQRQNALAAIGGLASIVTQSASWPDFYPSEVTKGISIAFLNFANSGQVSKNIPLSDAVISQRNSLKTDYKLWRNANSDSDPSRFTYELSQKYLVMPNNTDTSTIIETMVSVFADPTADKSLKAALLFGMDGLHIDEFSDYKRDLCFHNKQNFDASWFFPELFSSPKGETNDSPFEEIANLRNKIANLEKQLGSDASESQKDSFQKTMIKQQREMIKIMKAALDEAQQFIKQTQGKYESLKSFSDTPIKILEITDLRWNSSTPEERKELLSIAFKDAVREHLYQVPPSFPTYNKELAVHKDAALRRAKAANDYLSKNLSENF